MIEFYVSGQSLKFYTPVIAADSLNYLTAKVNFTDTKWDGYSKWLHFRQDEELGSVTYDMQLDENDEITAEQNLCLTVGQWEIYLTGTMEDSRLTTVPVILTVKESGLIDAPLHELPLSVAEQVDYNARQALLVAQAVKDMADAGRFDGKDGTSFSPLGYFAGLSALEAAVTEPAPGDVYGVGEAPPYDMYSWDGVNLIWVNNGPIQGAAGEKGDSGAVFVPFVDSSGNISWTNDGGLDNPATRNIMGPPGEKGESGADGPGAFEKAQEAGYTGTEDTFYSALAYMPYHNARHLPDGADPVLMESGNIKDAAVTRAKLAEDALYSPMVYTTATPYVFTTSDIGKTFMTGSSLASSATDVVYTVNDDFGLNVPNGTEIAVIARGGINSTRIVFEGAQRSAASGELMALEKTYEIPEDYGMVALKKINYGSDLSWWLVTGNVEVVE